MPSREGTDLRSPNSVQTTLTRGGSCDAANRRTISRTVAMAVKRETAIVGAAINVGDSLDQVSPDQISPQQVSQQQVSPQQVNPQRRGLETGVITGRAVTKPPRLNVKVPVRALARHIVIEGPPANHPNSHRTTEVLTTGAQIRSNRRGLGSVSPDRVVATEIRAGIRARRRRTTETSRGKATHRSKRHADRDSRTSATCHRASNAGTI